jgi:hypothetical protein
MKVRERLETTEAWSVEDDNGRKESSARRRMRCSTYSDFLQKGLH